MTWTPQLNVVFGRCGKSRGLAHTCVSSSRRSATLKPQVTFGTCGKCKKPLGNPLTHVCHPKSDFKKRKSRAAKAERAEARKKRQAEKHDYQACADKECPRSLCVAFKTGWKLGEEDGYDRGYEAGYAIGFIEGIAACPRNHSG